MRTDRTNRYRFGYSRKEMERLGNQHHIWAEENRRLLARTGFGAGATLVDLGCGPGYTTIELANLVGPEGRIIAVDRDSEGSLPLLKERSAAAGLLNIETIAADLETFDLPDSSVDGVYGRWVLMYLPERSVASTIARVARWLRPGGVCTLAEFCNFRHIHIHPPCVHLPLVAEALFQAVQGSRGCNPEIGSRVPGLLHSAGLRVELNVVTKTVRATTPEWHWPDALFRDHLQGLVAEGYLNRGVLDAFFMEWEQRSLDPEALFFGSPLMEAIGRRP
ncbi:MAG: methyltransferase domain-containing protein [Desulfosarcinaceae bacterium]|jgi:ubiquinone/menaquinone biosynthesis C-methylase UbiE